MTIKNLKKQLIIAILFSLLLPLYPIRAFSQYYQGADLAKEISITSDDSQLKIDLPAKTFEETLGVYLNEDSKTTLPNNLKPLSKIYTIFLQAEQKSLPVFSVQLLYNNDSGGNYAKDIYVWQEGNIWKKMETNDDLTSKTLTATITGNPVTIGAFEAPDITLTNNSPSLVSSDGGLEIITPNNLKNSDYFVTFKTRGQLDGLEADNIISDLYEYEFNGLSEIASTSPLTLKIYYQKNSDFGKDLYFWDIGQNQWVKMPATDNFNEGYLTAKTNNPHLIMAVFGNDDIQEGRATWYRYKNCLCAASRDYPKGTKLKVTNLVEKGKYLNKSVIVKINDYGPEEWTGNLIDLDKKAYQQIGNPKSGIINVRIEKIQ